MTKTSCDLFNSFGKLFQNRGFFLAVSHHGDNMGQKSPRGGRGPMRLLQLFKQSPDGLTNAEIAQILDIRPSSVSAMISRLEDAEILERVPSETDKRAVIIRLTDRGQEMLAHQNQRVEEIADQMFNGLTETEQIELTRLLQKLNQSTSDLDWSAFMGHGHGIGKMMGGMGGHHHGRHHSGGPKEYGPNTGWMQPRGPRNDDWDPRF